MGLLIKLIHAGGVANASVDVKEITFTQALVFGKNILQNSSG